MFFYQVNMIKTSVFRKVPLCFWLQSSACRSIFSGARVESVLTEEPQDIALAEYFLKFTTFMKFEDSTRAVLREATDLNQYLAMHDIGYIEKGRRQKEVRPEKCP
jgi:hypothetical protein